MGKLSHLEDKNEGGKKVDEWERQWEDADNSMVIISQMTPGVSGCMVNFLMNMELPARPSSKCINEQENGDKGQRNTV